MSPAAQPWTPPVPQWTPPAQQWTQPAPPIPNPDGAPQWAPQPAYQNPEPFTNQVPAVDPNQSWGRQQPSVPDQNRTWGQPQFGGGFATPSARKSGGLGIILPIACIALMLALVGVSAFSYLTITNDGKTLTSTKNSLNAKYDAEANAHKSDVAALTNCIGSMTSDETDLTELIGHFAEVEAARASYESMLSKGLIDEHQSLLDLLDAWDAKDQTAFNAALSLGAQGEDEMKSAAALKTALDGLLNQYGLTSADAAAARIADQIAATTTQCDAAAAAAARAAGLPQPVTVQPTPIPSGI
jgi:hypothetical protein